MHTRRAETYHPVPDPAVIGPLKRGWWLLLLRGIAGVLFGIAAFIWPGLTVLALTLLYGAFAFADGVFSFGAALTGGGDKAIPTWWLALIGLLGIAAGTVAFLWPGLTAFALILMIGAWAVAIGVLEIIGAIWLRKELEDEWLLIVAGILSVLFGIALLLRPGAGAVALAWAIGAYALASGVLHLLFAFRLKGARAELTTPPRNSP